MSAISRICLRCRLRILSDGSTLPPLLVPWSRATNQLAFSKALRFRDQLLHSAFLSTKTAKTPHTPGDLATPSERPAKATDELCAAADPVLARLTGVVEPPVEMPLRRPLKALTTVDVEEFLAAAKRLPSAPKKTPSVVDAHMIDEKYEELLSASRPVPALLPSNPPPPLEELERKFKYSSATHTLAELSACVGGEPVTVHGFIRSARRVHKGLVFLDLYDFCRPATVIQVVSSIHAGASDERKALQDELHKLSPFVPVAVTGTVSRTHLPPPPGALSKDESRRWDEPPAGRPEIQMELLVQLNTVSPELIYTPETIFPPEKRHLQLRTSPLLRDALYTRNRAADLCRRALAKRGFLEVETPLLFKSTSEGAREFLVPTRNPGMFYALPQSPQQYKQILMASGVPRYYQFAKCFRDEDLRTDRQPEFTQLDLEMSFARGEDVIRVVQSLLRDVFSKTLAIDLPSEFPRLAYKEAMRSYGTDKPDLRHGFLKIHRTYFTHSPGSTETFHIKRGKDHSIETMKSIHDSFVADFSNESGRFRSYVAGENSAHGLPLVGLSAQDIEDVNERLNLEEGDIVVLKRRYGEFQGSITYMGRLRQALIGRAVEAGVLQKPKGFEPVWITDFPLFTPLYLDEPRSRASVGLTPTHHPFTAPHGDDFALLAIDPLKVRAEHYDIVINGIELGGGSRRIHDPELQRFVLADLLKLGEDKLRQFDHLLDVLGSGCPPHAGLALGFDRLISLLVGTNNIRDTIAFPKNHSGADPLVDSPSTVSDGDLETYGLRKTWK